MPQHRIAALALLLGGCVAVIPVPVPLGQGGRAPERVEAPAR
jgi:hypothetical protein